MRSDTSWPDRGVYSESFYPLIHYGWAPLRSLRTQQHKYIHLPKPELYDLLADPREQRNILLDQRLIYRDLKTRLQALKQRIQREQTEAVLPDMDEETLAQLRALGYVAGKGGVDVNAEDDQRRADPKDKVELHRLIMIAQSDIGQGHEDKAEKSLRKWAADDQIIDAHQMLGNITAMDKRFNEAVPYFKAALALDDSHKNSLAGLSMAYKEMGKLEEALLGFQRLRSLSGNDGRTTSSVVDIYMLQNKPHKAQPLLLEATGKKDDPSHPF